MSSQIYEATHHTHYTQRLNISNVGQSARTFQGNYWSTFPDACQYLRALCRLRIRVCLLSGPPEVSEAAWPLQGPSKANNKSRGRRAVVRLPSSAILSKPRRAPPHCAPEAPRRGTARRPAKLGCENGLGRAEKCFSVYRRAQSTAGHPRRQQGSGSTSGEQAQGARGVPG